MKAPVQKLYDELQDGLSEFTDMGVVPIQQLDKVLQAMSGVMAKLKAHIITSPFANQEEEITFFKREKPLFLAERFYAIDCCMIQTARPCYDKGLIREYLENELRLIAAYFGKYGLLYQYYLLDSSAMDALLFTRGNASDALLTPDTADRDPEFSTAGDHAWARFIAFERLKEWLLEELRLLDVCITPSQNAAGSLKWTGNSVNLAELAYGIWLTGQINNGNVSVSEIAAWLELNLQVRIGDAHRRWQSIAARKRVGPFVYVDEMKAALVKRLEEEWGR